MMYAIEGQDAENQVLSLVERANSNFRATHSVAALGDHVYAVGGYTGVVSSVERYIRLRQVGDSFVHVDEAH